MNRDNQRRRSSLSLLMLVLAIGVFWGGCGAKHKIIITPHETLARIEPSPSSKSVAYVITNRDRYKEYTSEGGGGDKVSYFPYRDLEKAIRDALRAVYADVIVIKSVEDSSAIQENNISFVFSPKISTASDSESAFTWPPTHFFIQLSCRVTNTNGKVISRMKVMANGFAEFSEFKDNPGLAGQRAASELSEKFKKKILANPKLL